MTRLEKSLCSEFAALLRLSGSSAEHPVSVAVQETHLSWHFLTDRFVYKLKKPVRFDFVDFRTLDQRRRACESEVRLNRRLAPDVYVDAIPITRDPSGSIRLGGIGPAVDWVVKMRRLPAERSLAWLIKQGTACTCDVANVARVVADFFASRPPLCVRPDDYRKRLAQQAGDSVRALSTVRGAEWEQDLRHVHAAQCRFLALFSDLLGGRVCDGRIVDGHGDLRPEHIYVETPPVVVDCIEFNDQLRHLDVADELALLAMECDRLKAEWVGQQIVDACCQTTRDNVPQVLMDFYKGLRAVFRAKVTSLPAAEQSAVERAQADALARDYLGLARRYLGPLDTPVLLVVGGLMGTGKSTLACGLGQLLGIDHLQTDEMRRELFGASVDRTTYEDSSYRSDMRHKVYDRLLQRANELLCAGQSAVLEGTFLTRCWRDRAIELACRHGALPLFVVCQCPRRVALARLARRTDDNPPTFAGQPDLYDRQAGEQEPLDRGLPVVRIDTTVALNHQLDRVAQRLRAELATAGMLAAPNGS